MEVAVGLYRLPPSQFTAKRNIRAKEVKATGDVTLAADVGQLVRPSAAAWCLNLFAVSEPALIDEFTHLAVELRQAQAHPDRTTVVKLAEERRKLISTTVQMSIELARDSGIAISAAAEGSLEHTLHAALGDPRALAAVFSGRLIRAVEYGGLDPVDLTDAVAVPDGSAGARKPPSRGKEEKDSLPSRLRAALLYAAERAKKIAQEQTAAVKSLDQKREEHSETVRAVSEQLDVLRSQVDTLQARQKELTERGIQLDRERSRVTLTAQRARKEADVAKDRADRFAPGG